jgi:hypothetical protein
MVYLTDLYSFKAKIYKLKLKLDNELVSHNEKQFADKYLNEILFLLEGLKF